MTDDDRRRQVLGHARGYGALVSDAQPSGFLHELVAAAAVMRRRRLG
jgi:hypothetical protein